MQQTKTTKVPTNSQAIADMMKMSVDEVRNFPFIQDIKDILRDYNFGVVNKKDVEDKLIYISLKCAEKEIYYFSTGVEKLLQHIKVRY